MVEHRRHKIGHRDDGSQKYRWRCPACHNAANGGRRRD
jgi:transposase-like protein